MEGSEFGARKMKVWIILRLFVPIKNLLNTTLNLSINANQVHLYNHSAAIKSSYWFLVNNRIKLQWPPQSPSNLQELSNTMSAWTKIYAEKKLRF